MGSTSTAITENVLKKAFECYFRRTIQKLKFSVADATTVGENFCSELKRLSVIYSFKNEQISQRLSVIAKYIPKDKYLAKYITEMKFFDVEISMYEDIFPKLAQLDYNEKVAPQLYYSNTTQLLLIEDLSNLNYTVLSKQKGLDMTHCLMVVKKLAYLHAASCALHKKDSTILPKYDKPVFQQAGVMTEFVKVSFGELIETCKNQSALSEYENKLKRSQDAVVRKVSNIAKIQSEFKVLNHGDCWTNNIMFRDNDKGKPAEVAFVDYQSSCYASPCLDLHYFLAISPQIDVKINYKKVINYYFECLLQYLDQLHIEEKPTRKSFDEDFRAMGFFGLLGAIVILPIIKSTRLSDASVENVINSSGTDGFRYHCFNNPVYLQEMMHFLPFYDMLGVFNSESVI